jgi:hypothetical protein
VISRGEGGLYRGFGVERGGEDKVIVLGGWIEQWGLFEVSLLFKSGWIKTSLLFTTRYGR